MSINELPEIGSTAFNQKAAVIWLEQQPEDAQSSLVELIFEGLLSHAAQPRQSSGSTCSKLCGFVNHCSQSSSPVLKNFAFARATSLKLFNYFIEWNEQDAHRSMRLVLDYLVSSIMYNPDVEISQSIKSAILDDTVSVITLQASRPSTKSSMIAIDHLLQKQVLYLEEVLHTYQRLCGATQEATWDSFISRVFEWMESQSVWTVAGKLLVTILTQPWCRDERSSGYHPKTWHKFILDGLITNQDILEPVKVYLFMPLFKADPASTLVYLSELTSIQKLTSNYNQDWDMNAMIWVALLEAGKKTGVVGEPDHGSKDNPGVAGQLPAHILEGLLCHSSPEARASGLSILVASPSTTKPYAAETLQLLEKHLPSFYEDVNPRIRYDVLGHSRNIIRRLHNSIEALSKEMLRVSKKSKNNESAPGSTGSVPTIEEVTRGDSREITGAIKTTSPLDTLRRHEEFIEWYASFLKEELVPTASYQRHITSLRAMGYFLKSTLAKGDKISITCRPASLLIDSTWFRSVLDLIMDPYDDVRETAASLIMLLQPNGSMSGPPPCINGLHISPVEQLQAFAQRSNELALMTARADHCDGAARSQELLCRWTSNAEEALNILDTICSSLEMKLSAAENDLAAAVLQAPVHGDFASIRYIWSSLSGIKLDQRYLTALDEIQDSVISFCQRIWQAVQHILCDDSPEGHLPEELQQVEGLDTKDLLSYSFRAIHESSNLLRIVAQNARHEGKNCCLAPSQRNFEDIGNLTFDELSNLRHRGAFSTVSQTFTACCQLIQPDRQNDGSHLLMKWYEGALKCIYTQGSTTRRSAGIPAIIVGILAAKTDSPSFRDVMERLQEIGRQPAFVSETDGSNLSQVHALNCIKDIFKTSFLSQQAEPYLTDCLQLAAMSLQSEVWAIRNCGLLLLRSLIDHLFGTNESKLAMEAGWDGRTVRISYHKFEALPELLVNLLELGKKSSGATIGTQTAEAVFPALDIIRRAGPPEGYAQKLYDIISWYLGSRIWHVREIAARTLCSLLLTPTWWQSLEALIGTAGQSSNQLHGALMTLRFLLERLLRVMPDQLSDDKIDAIYACLGNLSTASDCLGRCTEVQAVYVDILNFVANTIPEQPRSLLQNSRIITLGQRSDERSLALLNMRRGEAIVRESIERLNKEENDILDSELELALATDINVACGMLEAIARDDSIKTNAAYARLVTTYMNVCFATEAPEPRTAALEDLSSLMDKLLSSSSKEDTLTSVPTEETLASLWMDLHRKPINPALSDAIIRISGPLLAVSVTRADGYVDESLELRLTSWGALISDAGMADRTFDTRIAAVTAVNSLSAVVGFPRESSEENVSIVHPAHLPWLLALYDALTDDDIEIREAAAEATGPLLGVTLVPAEAGTRLLQWLAGHFGHDPDFLMHVAGRMVGHNFGSASYVSSRASTEGSTEERVMSWVSAKEHLAEAMRFDDALFVIEEHNQYIDEVREAKRWAEVFLMANLREPRSTLGNVGKALGEWTLVSLHTLIEIAQSESALGGDGPLGWTSKPQVFAICARTLLCASVHVKLRKGQDGPEGLEYKEGARGDGKLYRDVTEALDKFWRLGHSDRTRIHGLLLNMCGIGE